MERKMSKMNEDAINRIKDLCKDQGLTPAAFARELGVSRQQVYRWFSLTQKMPDQQIEASAQALGIHPAKLRYEQQGAEIDKQRLAKVITEIKVEADKRRIKLSDAQFGHIVASVYSNGNGQKVTDFLDVLSV
jgi:transcriptional regulator with XRE-family HTH domain